MHQQPPQPLLPSLGWAHIVLTVQEHPPQHGEQNPAHAEEGGLQPEHGQHQGEQGPEQTGHLEVQRLNDPDTIHELETLSLLVDNEVEDGDHSHESWRHVQRADQPGLAAITRFDSKIFY